MRDYSIALEGSEVAAVVGVTLFGSSTEDATSRGLPNFLHGNVGTVEASLATSPFAGQRQPAPLDSAPLL